jgi:hypothetical protein
MKDFWLAILAVLSLALFSNFSCNTQTATVTPGQEFQLSPGGRAYVAGENLGIEFVGVTQDSRCPIGAVCIQAGQVVCLVNLTVSGSVYQASLTEPGGSQQAEQIYLGYNFVFNVLPYPEAGKDLRFENYRLVLKVTRAG